MRNIAKGEEIFTKIKDSLKGQEGRMIAIELDSGDYFIGEDSIHAIELGKKKYPCKQFYLKRIGTKCAFVIGAV